MSDQSSDAVVEPEKPPQPQPQRDRRYLVWGAILVIVGVFFLLTNLFPATFGSSFLLMLGLVFMAAYLLGDRKVGFLIAGGILTGLGLGVLVTELLLRGFGTVVVLFLGLGFLSIWVFERRMFWALITGGILTILGAILLSAELYGTRATDILRWWPVILVVLGVWLLWRQFVRRPGRG